MSYSVEWFANKLLPAAIVLLSFPVTGYCVGWFVGNSRAPVVATLIPLIVGLLGAITYAILERRQFFGKMLELIDTLSKSLDVTAATTAKLKLALGEQLEPSFWMPALWAIGVVLFSGACLYGAEAGVRNRVPTYPPVESLISNLGLDAQEQLAAVPSPEPMPPPPKRMPEEPTAKERMPEEPTVKKPSTHTKPEPPTAEELALLHELRWHFQIVQVPTAEVEAFFHESIIPILKKPLRDADLTASFRYPPSNYARTAKLKEIVDRIRKIPPKPEAAIPQAAPPAPE